MRRSNSGDWKMIFGIIWVLSVLVWWCMEEQDGRRRRQQEKISIRYWSVRTRNSLPPSSSRSFRTQSHWSYTARQCINSRQFLRAHLSSWMCSQFTLHHKFRINSGEDKILAGTDRRYSLHPWIPCTRIARSKWAWSDLTTSCIVQAEVDKASRHGCTGSTYSLLSGKDWSSIKQGRTQSSHTIRYTPSLLYPEGYHDEIWRNRIPEEGICVTSITTEDFQQR